MQRRETRASREDTHMAGTRMHSKLSNPTIETQPKLIQPLQVSVSLYKITYVAAQQALGDVLRTRPKRGCGKGHKIVVAAVVEHVVRTLLV